MLDKTSRSAMHKEHSIPRTPANKAPKVDSHHFLLKSNFHFLQNNNTELVNILSALSGY